MSHDQYGGLLTPEEAAFVSAMRARHAAATSDAATAPLPTLARAGPRAAGQLKDDRLPKLLALYGAQPLEKELRASGLPLKQIAGMLSDAGTSGRALGEAGVGMVKVRLAQAATQRGYFRD